MGWYVRLRRPHSAHEGHGMNFCEVQVNVYQYEGECSRLIWFHCVNNPRIQYIVCQFVTRITTLQIVFCYVTTRPATLYFFVFCRDHSAYGIGQWEKALHSKTSSHWLIPYTEWSLFWLIVYVQHAPIVNLCPISAPYMRQWTGSALVQVMACRLSGDKPLPKPVTVYCQLDHYEKMESNF